MQTRKEEGKRRREKCRTLRARSFEENFMVQQDPFLGLSSSRAALIKTTTKHSTSKAPKYSWSKESTQSIVNKGCVTLWPCHLH
jgi:hypothetical protein